MESNAGCGNQSRAGIPAATSSASKSLPQAPSWELEESNAQCEGHALLPSMVTWKTLRSCATSSSIARNTSKGDAIGLSSDKRPWQDSVALPSMVTWACIQTPSTAPRAAIGEARPDKHELALHLQPPECTDVDNEGKRRMDDRAASDNLIGNLATVKNQLAQARKIVSELRGQRAEAERQLSDMEREFAQSQLAANQRLWDAAAQGDVDDLRCVPALQLPMHDLVMLHGRGNMIKELQCRHLVALGADLEAGDPEIFGRTSLHLAAYHGQVQAVRTLVKLGAHLNASSVPLRWTALHYAAQRGQNETVKVLIELGADPMALNDFGKTPCKLARLNGHSWLAAWLANHTREGDDTLDSISNSLQQIGLSQRNSTLQVLS